MSFAARFAALDETLVAAGFPPTSPWWRETIQRFYATGRRALVLRVGRRGGKSSTLCRVAVCEALWGEHRIPPGDVGVVAFISVSRDESAQRLRTIEAILRAVGVAFTRRGDAVELSDRPIVFKTFTATISGVAGFTAICVIGDELAKWRDSDTGSNPAKEVVGSVKPTVATQRGARLFWSSSAFGTEDHHFAMYELGDTPAQLTAYAPTWIANPTITEADTHNLESDERVWLREYKAIPQGSVSSAFDEDAINAAMRPAPRARYGAPICALDWSDRRDDSTAWIALQSCSPVIGRPIDYTLPEIDTEGIEIPGVYQRDEATGAYLRDDHGNAILNPGQRRESAEIVFSGLQVIDPHRHGHVPSDEAVAAIGRTCRQWGIRRIYADQHSAGTLTVLFRDVGLRYESIPWTNPRKVEAVSRLRMLMHDRSIVLPQDEDLRREFNAFQEKITPSGSVTYAGRGHDDRVCAVLAGIVAELEGHLPGSRIGNRSCPRRYASLEARQRAG